MGCDIHLLREKLTEGRWVTCETWAAEYGTEDKELTSEAYTGRNYNLFYCLAQVRGTDEDNSPNFKPRGLPLSPSPETIAYCESWGVDGHSHSHLYLFELEELLAALKECKITVRGMKDKEELQKLNDSIATGDPDWDLLYPYCAWASSPNFVGFEIGVPGDYLVGDCLRQIIDGLKEVGGDMQRIVFWFDN